MGHLGARVRGFLVQFAVGVRRFLVQASRFSTILGLGFDVSGPGSEVLQPRGSKSVGEGLKTRAKRLILHFCRIFSCFPGKVSKPLGVWG